MAHTIQLGVKEALRILKNELDRIRQLVIRCKKKKKRLAFGRVKIELGFESSRVVPRIDTETRWGITYELVVSCYQLKSVFNALFNRPELDLSDLRLDDYEWEKMFSVESFLEKAQVIT